MNTRTLVTALGLTVLVPLSGLAQPSGVDPAINERFREPDVAELQALLEREDRNVYQARHAVVEALGLAPGSDVADVGAGTGFLTRLIAERVGPSGKVFSVEITPELVEHNVASAREKGLENVIGVLGTDTATNLEAGSSDLVLVCYTYHHFEHPEASLASIRDALRDDGRLVVIDRHRIKGVSTDEQYYHHYRGGKGMFTDEIIDAGFELERDVPSIVADSYFLVFKKRELR